MQEYYDDMKRKQKQPECDQPISIPKEIGKQRKAKISEDEVQSIHNLHKRVKLSSDVGITKDFEIN